MPDSAAWTLYGIEPPDNTWRDSDEETHRAGWRYIAEIGCDRFHWRCNQGLDAKGKPLTPIREATRRRGRKRSRTGLGNASNPPLVPALGLSRAENLLKGRAFPDHAEWYWTVDPVTGLHWGQVMLWHAQGAGHLPVRDVIGWSPDDIAWFRVQFGVWWYAHKHGQRVAKAMATLETNQERFPRVPAAKSAQFRVTGHVDLEHFTFGVGGTEQMVRRSIEEGTFSGFRRRAGGWNTKPGAGKPAAPKKPKAPPRMVPMVAPAAQRKRPAAVAKESSEPIPIIWRPAVANLPNPLRDERIPPPVVDLAEFAKKARAAARKVPYKFGGEKVFISQAHQQYVRDHGPISLGDFKLLLGRSLQARHIDLSRLDMVEGKEFDSNVVNASITYHPMSTREFNFINLD